jgi:hypothetical protein
MGKYTSGPWTAGHTPFYLRMGQQGEPLTIRSPHNTEEICTVWTCCQPTEANARLIAAAPDLLEALNAIIDAQYNPDKSLANLNSAIENAKKIVQKATGAN